MLDIAIYIVHHYVSGLDIRWLYFTVLVVQKNLSYLWRFLDPCSTVREG